MVVTVDGKERRNWNEVLQALLGHVPAVSDQSTIADRALRAGDKVTMIGVARADLPQDFWQSIARVGLSVCYGSVFDEFWIVQDARLGGQSTWRRTESCPMQKQGEDF